MRSRGFWFCLVIAVFVVVVGWWRVATVERVSAHSAVSWNQKAAAQYLDSREVWWQEWPRAHKDHETLCISCHTVLPYALARPVLSKELGEAEMPAPEKVMTASVEKRVNNWAEMIPFYSDEKSGPGKTAEAHATEAVLNAVILASYDGREGHLRPVTRKALESAWALQEETGEIAGGWKWQDFKLGPWESSESSYQGAAILRKVVAEAPDGYAKEPDAKAHVVRLEAYLRQHYAAQPLMNQLYVLRAGLLTAEERKTLLDSVCGLEESDGGWKLASLYKRERVDKSPAPTDSDGYATALVVLTMEESGVSRKDAALRRGVAWLETHQEKDGHWPALSMNKQRKADDPAAPFMSDAATGYAVLALEKAR
jgi:squalene-hopene/tetraprenyl-beta-curcumene cyclase